MDSELQMVAFDTPRHSVTKNERAVDSITSVGNALMMHAAHRRNYSNAPFRYFWFGDIIKRHTLALTSQKVENGVVEVDDGEDDIAMDSKGTAVL